MNKQIFKERIYNIISADTPEIQYKRINDLYKDVSVNVFDLDVQKLRRTQSDAEFRKFLLLMLK